MAHGVGLDDESKKRLLTAIGDLHLATSMLYEALTEIESAVKELRKIWEAKEEQIE